jgi:acyl-CoA synthetase (NDP forming)
VDMVLALNVTPPMGSTADVLRAISDLPVSREKPLLTAFMAEESFYPEVASIEGAPPVYRYPEPAAGSLRALVDYAEWLSRPAGGFERFEVDTGAAEGLLSRAVPVGEGEGPGLLDHGTATALLEAYGVKVPVQVVAGTAREAAAAAEAIGGRVAIKALGHDLLHRTDAGGVALRLIGGEDVLDAANAIQQTMSESEQSLDGFVVQEMIEGGVELIASARHDPVFGRLLLVGLGGYFTEALKDVQAGLLPVGPDDVLGMLRSLKGYPVLTGGERGGGIHIPTIVELLGRLAQMALEHPRLSEVELNPVICMPEPGECYAVDIVMRTGPLR